MAIMEDNFSSITIKINLKRKKKPGCQKKNTDLSSQDPIYQQFHLYILLKQQKVD